MALKQISSQTKHRRLLILVECAIMVALAFILDFLPLPRWPNGGSVSVTSLPLIYISYRHGLKWGVVTGFVHSVLQLMMGWYAPPAGTLAAVIACVLLDYILAFTILGTAVIFVPLGGKNSLVGYGIGAVAANLLRFGCSFLSGIFLWGSYAPEGQPVWFYSLTYNGGYMIPNALVAAVCIVLLCTLADPKTLRPRRKKG